MEKLPEEIISEHILPKLTPIDFENFARTSYYFQNILLQNKKRYFQLTSKKKTLIFKYNEFEKWFNDSLTKQLGLQNVLIDYYNDFPNTQLTRDPYIIMIFDGNIIYNEYKSLINGQVTVSLQINSSIKRSIEINMTFVDFQLHGFYIANAPTSDYILYYMTTYSYGNINMDVSFRFNDFKIKYYNNNILRKVKIFKYTMDIWMTMSTTKNIFQIEPRLNPYTNTWLSIIEYINSNEFPFDLDHEFDIDHERGIMIISERTVGITGVYDWFPNGDDLDTKKQNKRMYVIQGKHMSATYKILDLNPYIAAQTAYTGKTTKQINQLMKKHIETIKFLTNKGEILDDDFLAYI